MMLIFHGKNESDAVTLCRNHLPAGYRCTPPDGD